MAHLCSKIIKYLDRKVDFQKDVIVQDDMISGISNPYIKEWNVAEAQPTEEQLDALENVANDYEALTQILLNRQAEYPSTGDQLDYIFHNGVAKWKTDIVQPVKDKYPKPS